MSRAWGKAVPDTSVCDSLDSAISQSPFKIETQAYLEAEESSAWEKGLWNRVIWVCSWLTSCVWLWHYLILLSKCCMIILSPERIFELWEAKKNEYSLHCAWHTVNQLINGSTCLLHVFPTCCLISQFSTNFLKSDKSLRLLVMNSAFLPVLGKGMEYGREEKESYPIVSGKDRAL